MIKLIFKSSVISLRKDKVVNFFSIMALATSLILLILSLALLTKELTINKGFEDSESIYRIDTKILFSSGGEQDLAKACAFAGPELISLANVKYQSRINQIIADIRVDNSLFENEIIAGVDTSFFEIFDHKIISGNAKSALKNPNCILLSETIALKIFGTADDVIGREIQFDSLPYTVCGVFEDNQSDINYSIYKSIYPELDEFDWVTTYIRLTNNEAEARSNVISGINEIMLDRMKGEYDEDAMSLQFDLTDLHQLHFSDKLFEKPKSNLSVIIVFSVFALVLFIISCINFINVVIASSTARLRGLLVRRIFGASNLQLLLHTAVEISLIFIISLVLSFVILVFFFEDITGFLKIDLALRDIISYKLVYSILLVYSLVLGLTIFLAHAIRLKTIYNSNFHSSVTIKLLLKYFMPLQTVISIGIITFSFVVHQQLMFINKPEVGFDYQNVYFIELSNTNELGLNLRSLKSELQKFSAVNSVSLVNKNAIPTFTPDIQLFQVGASASKFPARSMFVDPDYFKVLDIPYKIEPTNDVAYKLLVNSEFRKQSGLDFADNPEINDMKVIGITDDIYQDGIYAEMEPIVYRIDSIFLSSILVKFNATMTLNDVKNIVAKVARSINENAEIDVYSLEDIYLSNNKSDLEMVNFLRSVTLLVYIVSIYGIFSLASLITKRRLKSIAIKKILGATTVNISFFSSLKVLKILTLSSIPIIPLIYYIINLWLSKFEVKIDNSFFHYLISIAVIIGLFVLFFISTYSKVYQLNISKTIRQEVT